MNILSNVDISSNTKSENHLVKLLRYSQLSQKELYNLIGEINSIDVKLGCRVANRLHIMPLYLKHLLKIQISLADTGLTNALKIYATLYMCRLRKKSISSIINDLMTDYPKGCHFASYYLLKSKKNIAPINDSIISNLSSVTARDVM